MKLNNTTTLEILHNVYHNYDAYLRQENIELETNILKKFNSFFQTDFLKFIGEVPIYTLHNVQKTKDKILAEDDDAIFCIVGKAGAGKSSLAFVLSYFIDEFFTPLHIIFTFEILLKFLKKCAQEIRKEMSIQNYKSELRGCSVVIDEGVFMLFSADSNTKLGKISSKLFSIIRFLNIVMFINVTNFEKLNKTIRESRIYSVIHIVKKGQIAYYSKKRTQKIEVTTDLKVKWVEPNFIEDVGFISKKSKFWEDYNQRKADFVLSAIDGVLNDL